VASSNPRSSTDGTLLRILGTLDSRNSLIARIGRRRV
jgi:hypothetical protein